MKISFKRNLILGLLLFSFTLESIAQVESIKVSKKTDWEVILDEQFSNNYNQWNTFYEEDFYTTITSGKLITSSNIAEKHTTTLLNVPFDYNNRDYDISFSVSNLNAYGGFVYNNRRKQRVDNPYFVFFWGSDMSTNDYNAISLHGYTTFGDKSSSFDLVSMVNGNGLKYDTFKSLYPHGLGPIDAFKNFKISKRGDKCYITDELIGINKGVLAIIPAPECQGNQIGLLTTPGAKVLVDYIIIEGESDYSYSRKFDNAGWEAINNNDYDNAIYYFDEVLKSGFIHPESYTSRAYANYLAENYLQGIDDCNLALKLDENFENAYFVRGLIKYDLLFDNSEIISDMEKAGEKGEEFILEHYNQTSTNVTGSGILLSNNGYVATNYHVVEGAKEILVYKTVNGTNISYNAEVVLKDITNDLAILKIESFKENLNKVPYCLKISNIEVGENVFALGFPMIDLQGTELKVTNGIISSKSGFKNDMSTFQISVPIQPGNSGGPLFDSSGNLIGITSSKLTVGENVGYAIKGLFLQNLLDNISDLKLSNCNGSSLLSNKTLPEQINTLRAYVLIIIVTL